MDIQLRIMDGSLRFLKTPIILQEEVCMGVSREFLEFVDRYASERYHRTHSYMGHDYYSYSSATGKTGISNYMIDVMVEYFTPLEMAFALKIVDMLKPSTDFYEAAVVKLTLESVKGFATKNTFAKYKRTLVTHGFLIETPEPKYFIVNPRYVNRFYKTVYK